MPKSKKEIEAKAAQRLLFKAKLKDLLENSNLFEGQTSETYSTDDLLEILIDANEQELRELSYSTCLISARYLRILTYYSTLLTNEILLTPIVKDITKNPEQVRDRYYKALDMMEQINPKYWIPIMNFYALVFGVCYAMFREIEGETIIQLLPMKFCRSRFLYPNGNPVVEFDMTYFTQGSALATGTSQSSVLPKPGVDILLAQFDEGFKKALNAFLRDNNERWYVLPQEQGIMYAPMDSKSPMFVNVVPDIVLLQEYKEIVKDGDFNDLRQILTNQIPMNKDGDDFLMDINEAKNLHLQLVKMLQNNPSIDVLTHFGDVQLLNTRAGQDTIAHDKLEKIERNIHASAGAPNEIFNSTNNAGLKYGIAYGTSIMKAATDKFVKILENKINSSFAKSGYYFKLNLLPISLYNQTEISTQYLKYAQAGFSKLMPMLAIGVSQLEAEKLLMFERDILELGDLIQTTQQVMQEEAANQATEQAKSADSNPDESGAGRPPSADENKSDKTVANENTPSGNEGV